MLIVMLHNLLLGSKWPQNLVAWNEDNPSIVILSSMSQEFRQGTGGMAPGCLPMSGASAAGDRNFWGNEHLGQAGLLGREWSASLVGMTGI